MCAKFARICSLHKCTRTHSISPDWTQELRAHLDERLCAATGGAPRLLLYTLRALHYVCLYRHVVLDSREKIEVTIDQTVFELLMASSDLSRELLPSDGTPETKHAFTMMLAFALYQTPLTYEKLVRISSGEVLQVGQLLKSLAFFLSRSRTKVSGHQFILDLPQYHLKATRDHLLLTGVPMLVTSMAGAGIRLGEPWRIFEFIPARVATLHALLLKPAPDATWAATMDRWFGGSEIAKKMLFDLGNTPYSCDVIDMLATLKDPVAIEARCNLRTFCVRADKSNSCDGVFFQRLTSGLAAVLQIQAKLWVDGFQPAHLLEEVGKVHCPASVYVVLCVLATELGEHLKGCVKRTAKRVLVLSSWSEDLDAVYVMTNEHLLWQSQQGGNKWFKWPGKDRANAYQGPIPQNASRISVRPRLEVVIPHPEVVREVVGVSLYDSIREAQQHRNDASTVSATICTMDTILAGPSAPVATTVSSIRDVRFRVFHQLADNVSMADAIAMIAKERIFTKEECDADISMLNAAWIRTVGDLRVLADPSDVRALKLSPVVTGYLLRIHQGGN